jgi:hypothetical protein
MGLCKPRLTLTGPRFSDIFLPTSIASPRNAFRDFAEVPAAFANLACWPWPASGAQAAASSRTSLLLCHGVAECVHGCLRCACGRGGSRQGLSWSSPPPAAGDEGPRVIFSEPLRAATPRSSAPASWARQGARNTMASAVKRREAKASFWALFPIGARALMVQPPWRRQAFSGRRATLAERGTLADGMRRSA